MLVLLLLFVGRAAAEEVSSALLASALAAPVTVYNELPNNGAVSPQALVGDLYEVKCAPGDRLIVTADALPDESGQIAHLDLVANIFKKNGEQIGFADDNQACGVPLECGYGCPRIEVVCPRSDNLTSTVFITLHDFGSAGQGCDDGGVYSMQVEAARNGVMRPLLVSVPAKPPHWAGVSAINSGIPSLFNLLPPPPPLPASAVHSLKGLAPITE